MPPLGQPGTPFFNFTTQFDANANYNGFFTQCQFWTFDPALNGWLNSQTIAQRAADADLDEVISLRLAGGSYRAIAQATGLTIARITRICREEAA